MSALAVLSLFLVISSGLSLPENEATTAEPEYLDSLLDAGQYELFAKIMNIPDVKLVRPTEGERNENPMFNKDLEFGDIVPVIREGEDEEEQSRQGINHGRYPGSRWQNNYIPIYVKESDFTRAELNTLYGGLNSWNDQIRCPKLYSRSNEADYVYIMKGDGCWSYLGRIGGQQALSLGNGCVYKGTVLHEMQHAAGFAHEQNRYDRDQWIEMLWDNIPEEWKSQYQITNSRDYGLQDRYDYYSVMHYPVKAPGTNRDAFRVKANGINLSRIGNGNDFTQSDINKLNELYCSQ